MTHVEALQQHSDQSILLLVLDGLGGLARQPGGPTELEAARTPHLDELAAGAECGLHVPVAPGVAPGSAPGHLSLFGYDPLDYPIGRGIVAALGIGYPIKRGDVAVRLNFASRDHAGIITDRRAGRIATELCAELCAELDQIEVSAGQIAVRPVRDYRAVLVITGNDLSDRVADTDPQQVDRAAYPATALEPAAETTASMVREFLDAAHDKLGGRLPANGVLLRGFAQLPTIPSLQDRFGIRPIALAVYPDYRGVSRLVGMHAVDGLTDLSAQQTALRQHWGDHDFFYVHHKYTDSTGEDGDFDAKVAEIEKVDAAVPGLLSQHPDVVIVTGDHSTPSVARSHTAHPVPFLIWSVNVRADSTGAFGEQACAGGSWGVLPGRQLLPIALGHAGKLARFGA